jgi:hypothetical protein
MRRIQAFLVLGLLASGAATAVLSGSAGAKNRPPTGNGIEAARSAAWPAVAAQLAKNIATDSFAHDYTRVWAYLHPTYRQAVSESQWKRCQGAHPAAPRNVTLTKVAVASATQLPVQLSLLGRQNVQEIQVIVQFKTPRAAGAQAAVLNTFWLKQASTWRAVWLSEEYAAYKAGKCYLTPQGPPLY